MRFYMRTLPVFIVCVLFAGLAAVAGGAAGRHPMGVPLAPAYSCTTTAANEGAGTTQSLHETDVFEHFGRWYHAVARPDPGQSEPFYDYYIGYVGKPPVWTYIQVSPQNTFVATAPSLTSEWHIQFPAGEDNWRVTGDFANPAPYVKWMRISHPDLTQECNATPLPAATPPWSIVLPAPDVTGSWTCKTALTGEDANPEYLSITQMMRLAMPATKLPVQNWWQGRATTTPGGGSSSTIYEFNLFYTPAQRVMVEVDASGSYTIATSALTLSPSIFPSTWTVIYPMVENGYTFEPVPQSELGNWFELIFADGYQDCTRG